MPILALACLSERPSSVSLEDGSMSCSLPRRAHLATLAGLASALCVLLQGCGQTPKASVASQPLPTPITHAPVTVETPPLSPYPTSDARTPSEYRLHAARHVYDQHAPQIFSGPMPPLLQAVGVLDIEIGSQGEVRRLNWLRPPSHVPEVMRQIESLIHRAAPYPAPLHLSSVTYTDTWLWHQSGRFQLHTLSEGQLGESGLSTAQDSKRRTPSRSKAASKSTLMAKCKQPATPIGQASAYC